ncbi:TMEM175 family protein [Kordia algicida OT-1]|uniref:Transglutaminase-like protein n=1 Tax=Kordia algicida OT-1 TaxID=391587 RepID=A9E6I6_9FLAO|nr:TMEM175 family protein [Kordia algicida]EDP95039.1 Transglutaminase-like protein [Kordia algicida OT-1]
MIKHSKNRLESLSDAVFAFAATLMVVNLGANADFSSLKEELPMFISFGISFFVMIALWKLHYNFFRRTKYVDNWIIAYNTFFLFMILFYVFPLKSLATAVILKTRMSITELSELFQLYSVGFSLIFLCLVLMYKRAYKKDTKNENPLILQFYKRHFFIFVLVGLISSVLAYFQLGIKFGLPGIIYSILGLLCYIHSKTFHKKYPQNNLFS